jgi:hypothetical protein
MFLCHEERQARLQSNGDLTYLLSLLYGTRSVHAAAIFMPEGAIAKEVYLLVAEERELDDLAKLASEVAVDGFDGLVVAACILDQSRWLRTTMQPSKDNVSA